jgi:hypothetical protein
MTAYRYVIGVQQCRACGYSQLSAWPTDIIGEELQCGNCGERFAVQAGPGYVLPASDGLSVTCAYQRLVDEKTRATLRN